MTEQDQVRALAELDGWIPYSPGDFNPTPRWMDKNANVRTENKLPNYLHSYDAIIPLIQKQWRRGDMDFMNGITFGKCLKEVLQHEPTSKHETQFDIIAGIASTPSQLCEALLRATERWRE